MNTKNKFLKKSVHFIPLIVFTALQAAIISTLTLFGDDFYYSTFTKSKSYFLSENLRHYREVNGRSFVHLIDELLLSGGKILPFQIFAVIVLALIAVMTALIAKGQKKEDIKSSGFRMPLPVSCLALSVFTIETSRQTLYWTTGFSNYVFPVLLTLLLFYVVEKGLEDNSFSIWLVPIAFFASSTTEQNAFASVFILIYALLRILVRDKTLKKIPASFWTSLVFALIGAVLLFMAPGNALRKTYYPDFYSLPLFERITQNVHRLSRLFFIESGASKALMLFFCAFACAAAERTRGVLRPFLVTLNGASAVSLLFLSHFETVFKFAVWVSVIAYAFDLVVLGIAFFRKKYEITFFFTAMALALQGAMLVSPEMGTRTVAVSIFFLSVPVTRIALTAKSPFAVVVALVITASLTAPFGKKSGIAFALILVLAVLLYAIKKTREASKVALVLAISLVVFVPLNTTLCGYRENAKTHRQNADAVESYRIELNEGKKPGTLRLSKLPNNTYRYVMPYDSGYNMYWFKRSCRLPDETQIEFN